MLAPASSGTPRLISRSNLPARRSEASSASGRLVAPMTMTLLPLAQSLRSSMQDRNCATILRSISLPAPSRLAVMQSISSKKRRDGAWLFALSNSRRMFASLFPLISGATIAGRKQRRCVMLCRKIATTTQTIETMHKTTVPINHHRQYQQSKFSRHLLRETARRRGKT